MKKSWSWEELTATDFALAVKETKGVCIVPCGVIEKHGEHLPLGTDVLLGRKLAILAAEVEPAVVFPFHCFGQIAEACHVPGTISYSRELLFKVLKETCNEIARNGMKKIIILSAHGGNSAFVKLFAQTMLEKKHDYVVYIMDIVSDEPLCREFDELIETDFDYHGGERETSMHLAINPELVKMEAIDPKSGKNLDRLAHLSTLFTGISWYSNFPDHYAGDARPATEAKGKVKLKTYIDHIANLISKVKADTKTQELQNDFFSKRQH